jgi:hypothetical protein
MRVTVKPRQDYHYPHCQTPAWMVFSIQSAGVTHRFPYCDEHAQAFLNSMRMIRVDTTSENLLVPDVCTAQATTSDVT